MDHLIEEILGKFKGFDWWVVLLALIACLAGWLYLSKKRGEERKTFIQQLVFVVIVGGWR